MIETEDQENHQSSPSQESKSPNEIDDQLPTNNSPMLPLAAMVANSEIMEDEQQENYQSSQLQDSRSPDEADGQLPIKRPPTLPPAAMAADSEIMEDVPVTPRSLDPQFDEPTDHSIVRKDSSELVLVETLSSPLLVPMALLLAAGIVYLYPERGIAVLLLLGALGTFGPTNGPLVCLLAEMFERVSLRTFQSEQLRTVAKEMNHAVVSDPHTKQAFAAACRDAMLDSRTLDAFGDTCTKSLTTSMANASKDEDLQKALNVLLQNGVKEALNDAGLINTFFTVLKEGLSDPKMHQAALKGAVSAANPLKDLQAQNPLRQVKSKVQEAMVNAEAAMLSQSSGLSRVTPPSRSSPAYQPSQPPN